MSFATTYAVGKAACYFLERRKAGTRDPSGVAETYRDALRSALKLARERGLDDPKLRKAQ
jgi:hypothetical protein